jgi:hypothetical protein
LSDKDALLAVNEADLTEFHATADIAWKAFDLKEGAVFHPILFAACFYYRVHEYRPP